MVNLADELPIRILSVIVLHKISPSASAAFRTLHAATSDLGAGRAEVKILLYDNTPGGQDPGVLASDIRYKADVENGGLARAYNYALDIAEAEGFDWLLTLDQDTTLPIDFLCKLCHTIASVAPVDTVAAIVPRISDGGRVISPFIAMKYWIWTKPFNEGFIGISPYKVYAANSASTIRVSALRAIGGYDPNFDLDYSDIVMYHRLQCNSFSIFIAGNINVNHEISGLDLTNRSTPIRYENALCAEGAFCDEYLGTVGHLVLLLKMFCRPLYRVWRMGGSLPHFQISLGSLFRRLFHSREHRMRNWKQSVRRF